jgi:TPR repeat protein
MDSFDSPEMVAAMNAIERRDYAAAFSLLEPLAKSGNPKAQCNLATLYDCGWGVERNVEKAVELYCRVAEQKIYEEHLSGIAYNNLASIYWADTERASEYRRLARAMGFEM